MILTTEQEKTKEELETWLRSSPCKTAVLTGFAGTGKTVLLTQLPFMHTKVLFTAPTNKAVRVLREKLAPITEQLKRKIDVCTTYSALKLQMLPDGEVKTLTKGEEAPDLTHYGLLVVDEASFVGKVLQKYLLEAADTFGFKILYCGDPLQLPPVKETKCIALEDKGANWHLANIVRSGDEILKVVQGFRGAAEQPFNAAAIRSAIDANRLDNGTAVRKALPNFLACVAAHAKNFPESFLSSTGARAVAWRNVTVDTLNQTIRENLFDKSAAQADKFLPSDRIVFTAPLKLAFGLVPTDEEGTVIATKPGYHTDYPMVECVCLELSLDSNSRCKVYVPTKKGQITFIQEKEHLRQIALTQGRRHWFAYHVFLDAFAQIKHSYALTAHRSQGSTFHTTFVDYKDILVNPNRPEALRCLYVAVSRASHMLVY